MVSARRKTVHYTQGDCWALAIAVHEMTGLPMLAVGYTGDDGEPPHERYWCHVVIKVDGGMVLDIRGLRPPEEAIAEFMKSHGVLWDITATDLQPSIDDAQTYGFTFCESWEQVREDAMQLIREHLPC